MTWLIISLIALAVIAAIMGLISQRRGGDDEIKQPTASCATCSGYDPKCEQECMLEAATKDIEYFDDEELDAFRGRPSDKYKDDEAEQFANVLYTMRHEEVAAWSRSLILRGINLPDQIKDEVIMIMKNEE